jgi:GLPGLI family protein
MKKIILVFTLILVNSSFGQTIEGKVIYHATINTDNYIEELKKNNEFPEHIKRVKIQDALNSRPLNFFLTFKNTESLYQAEFDLDKERDLGLGWNQLSVAARVDYICYSNLKNKENIRQSFWMKNVVITVEPIVWEFSNETKKIGKYTCFKATSTLKEEREGGGLLSEKIIAWYTPEIPILFGIQNFVGLPGLTIEMTHYTERGTVFYIANNIELDSKENIVINKPKGKEITHREFIELTRR